MAGGGGGTDEPPDVDRVADATDATDETPAIEGSCHCGNVRLTISETPHRLTHCDCSICRRLGALWAHVEAVNVRVENSGPVREYVWGERLITFHRCDVCGCTTHWTDRDPEHFTRTGVNFRMCPPEIIARFPVHERDGASDEGSSS